MSDIVADHMAIIRNLATQEPLNLDSLLATKTDPSTDIVPYLNGVHLPSKKLWKRSQDDPSFIGIRITAPIESPEQIVTALAAIAVERRITPIFISWIGDCGLQRFALRVEHVSGVDEAEKLAIEEHLKRLWNLAIIIDAGDVSAL